MLPLTSSGPSRRGSLLHLTNSPGGTPSLGLQPIRDPSNLRFLAGLLAVTTCLLFLGLHPDTYPLSGAFPRRRGLSGLVADSRLLARHAEAAAGADQGPTPRPLPASPAPSPPALPAGLPEDFDAEAYRAYHPHLDLPSARAAAEHYLAHGREEGLVAHRLRVLLRYTACTGLINQHYSHIAAFSLASVLGAEVVLPPAVCRDSFAHYFSVFKEKNEVQWAPVPLDSLLDVPALIAWWKARGIHVHETPALTPFPDLTQPGVAFPLYAQPGVDPDLVVRVEGVYLKNMELGELVDLAREAVVGRARERLLAARGSSGPPSAAVPYVVLDLPCSFFMLRTLSDLGLVSGVARSLAFAPALHALADRVVDEMTRGGVLPFNGVHLRIEKDARDWAMIMGGEQVVWQSYVKTMRGVGQNESVPLYAASGMLTYGASTDMLRTVAFLKHMRVCSEIHHKEMYIPKAELELLNSEQEALLDFIVLSKSRLFVGFGSSTFSFYLREYRSLQNMSRSTSSLVDASIIGTDALFASAGTVV
uniref:O-fucosyltransferase family protein n=1 Tax=Auxenochlorella protothecoides TaxID=3075 RepID=A0A1D2A093_AUXPR